MTSKPQPRYRYAEPRIPRDLTENQENRVRRRLTNKGVPLDTQQQVVAGIRRGLQIAARMTDWSTTRELSAALRSLNKHRDRATEMIGILRAMRDDVLASRLFAIPDERRPEAYLLQTPDPQVVWRTALSDAGGHVVEAEGSLRQLEAKLRTAITGASRSLRHRSRGAPQRDDVHMLLVLLAWEFHVAQIPTTTSQTDYMTSVFVDVARVLLPNSRRRISYAVLRRAITAVERLKREVSTTPELETRN